MSTYDENGYDPTSVEGIIFNGIDDLATSYYDETGDGVITEVLLGMFPDIFIFMNASTRNIDFIPIMETEVLSSVKDSIILGLDVELLSEYLDTRQTFTITYFNNDDESLLGLQMFTL